MQLALKHLYLSHENMFKSFQHMKKKFHSKYNLYFLCTREQRDTYKK